MFDKKVYSERRKAGQRGQIDLTPPPQLAVWTEEDYKAGKCGEKSIGKTRTSGVTMVMSKKGLIANPRKLKRRKVVDRHFAHRGFTYGVRTGGKMFNIIKSQQKRIIGETFGKLIIVSEKDGKPERKKYVFPAKSRHLRTVTDEQRRHLELNPLQINPNKTNHQRMLERKELRNAKSTGRAAVSAA